MAPAVAGALQTGTAFSTPIWSPSHVGNRSPSAFAKPRAVFTKLVCTEIKAARTRMTINAACAFSLRCWMGRNNSGSMRAKHAKVCASKRSSFRLLSLISFTCRGLATTSSCPRLPNKRLTHGEWVPTSMAIRARPSEPNVAVIPALLVGT